MNDAVELAFPANISIKSCLSKFIVTSGLSIFPFPDDPFPFLRSRYHDSSSVPVTKVFEKRFKHLCPFKTAICKSSDWRKNWLNSDVVWSGLDWRHCIDNCCHLLVNLAVQMGIQHFVVTTNCLRKQNICVQGQELYYTAYVWLSVLERQNRLSSTTWLYTYGTALHTKGKRSTIITVKIRFCCSECYRTDQCDLHCWMSWLISWSTAYTKRWDDGRLNSQWAPPLQGL